MLHSNVRRLTAAVFLVLVLAAVPALAAPGPHPHTIQAPVAGLSLFEGLLGWLGFPIAEGVPGLHGRYEKSTAAAPMSSSTSDPKLTTLNRGAMVDPNG
jgi:hypothetical protein